MNVLWITNIVFPEVLTITKKSAELKSSGGWMIGLSNALLEKHDIILSVASVSSFVKRLTVIRGELITYYVLPIQGDNTKYAKSYEPLWKEVCNAVKPDIVHIHGTEYAHGLAFMNACPDIKTVISIQGLLSSCYRYYNQGLDVCQILSNTSLIELIKSKTLFQCKRQFKSRGEEIEKTMLRRAHNVIGRTKWDRALTWAINPRARYYHCNEVLRDEFYTGCWSYDFCIKHTIFISQAGYPIKGLHMLLKAMPLILREAPDAILKIAGNNIIEDKGYFHSLRQSCYSRIIRSLIKTYKLENHVVFLGPLSAVEMKSEFLRSNVFVSPSSIENSPNSLGEAQLLGVPCVSSYVGGVADMIPDSACGTMYRFEEVDMLAYTIVNAFSESRTFDNVKMRQTASIRHDKKQNAEKQYQIYLNLINEND